MACRIDTANVVPQLKATDDSKIHLQLILESDMLSDQSDSLSVLMSTPNETALPSTADDMLRNGEKLRQTAPQGAGACSRLAFSSGSLSSTTVASAPARRAPAGSVPSRSWLFRASRRAKFMRSAFVIADQDICR